MGMGTSGRSRIAERAAKEILPGMAVNLGIGIPSLVPDFLPRDFPVMIHAENGILGIGPAPAKGMEDEDLCNAAGFPVTEAVNASYFDTSLAFGMIRGGHIDVTILGALEVSETGDLANWIVPGKKVPGIGGAMELALKAKKVIAVLSHSNKSGGSKLKAACTLPLTAEGCVDLVITEKAVLKPGKDGFQLVEVLPPYTLEEVIRETEANIYTAGMKSQ
ncbi:3-oxoacid CoA-transferase subunit B [Metabacillus sp. GX 13764]|uniref:3-oxoacid CoA-transferase subunit B n=1 Tax=Metabacillus kandeliae TaxID=2900151 RepID=UPI001E438C4D|nr:3-oxoacid CoA-transferase subunit B [Metabacillus kandeliae]MCD7033485.1 3-oxoacid CoA-transferase subunit B [Metabacillus kandeliae]